MEYHVIYENKTDVRYIPESAVLQIKGSIGLDSDDSYEITLLSGEVIKKKEGFKAFISSTKS